MTIIILKDGTTFEIAPGYPLSSTRIKVVNVDDFANVYRKMTDENLSSFLIETNERKSGEYKNFSLKKASLEGEYGVFNIVPIGTEEDPSVITVIEEVPDDYSEAGRILLGEEE